MALYMNFNARKVLKKFFDRFFWRQHPETALRYLPVVAAIKQAGLADAKILEVGSGSLGIIPYLRAQRENMPSYLKRPIDGVDIDFSGPATPLLTKIKGSAESLPFRKNSYDVVVSVDTLEHLPSQNRQRAIYEMLRVAKKLAIIVVPVGDLSQNQDKELDLLWRKIFGEGNQFLAQHIKHGLPTQDQILVYIDKCRRLLKKNARVSSSPLLNLQVRQLLMRTWISKNKLSYYLYLKGYLLLIPFLRLANFGNCYRRIFVIELAPHQISN